MIAINGRTNRTQFMTASNGLKQQLQQIINETSNGYFPNSNNFTCTAGLNAPPTLANGSQQQGTNGGCVFLGKALQFGVTGSTNTFLTYAITGNRLQTGTNQEITSLAQAYPVAVAPGNSSTTNATLNGITVSNGLEGGLTAAKMTYGATNTATGGFAVLSTLASYTASGSSCDGVCSGGQGVNLYAIDGTGLGTQDSKTFVDSLDGGSAKYVATTQIVICFNSGSTNQSALYTIGGTGSSQSVVMKIQSGACV
jgi:hypothetical protein